MLSSFRSRIWDPFRGVRHFPKHKSAVLGQDVLELVDGVDCSVEVKDAARELLCSLLRAGFVDAFDKACCLVEPRVDGREVLLIFFHDRGSPVMTDGSARHNRSLLASGARAGSREGSQRGAPLGIRWDALDAVRAPETMSERFGGSWREDAGEVDRSPGGSGDERVRLDTFQHR